MTVEENLATHRRWAEADNRRDLSHHHEFVHEDITVYHLDGNTIIGREALIKNMQDSIAAMPDYSVEIDDRFATDARVVARWRVRGTPRKGSARSAGGASPIEVSGISVWEFEDGKARRGWVCSNAEALMRQGIDGADAYSTGAHARPADPPGHEDQ